MSSAAYSGGDIDITGLVPSSSGGPATVSFLNQSETNRYKQQQYAMQMTQYGTQMGLHGAMQQQSSSVLGETQALKVQSANEISGVQKDQSVVQTDQGGQLHAQYMQHMDTQLVQGSLGSQISTEQRNLATTLDQQAAINQSAFRGTTSTQYDIMAQQRQTQLAAIEQARNQQMAMLQSHHNAIGMTITPTSSFSSSPYSSTGSTHSTSSSAYSPSMSSYGSHTSSLQGSSSVTPYGGAGTTPLSPLSPSFTSSIHSSLQPPSSA
jgi:hypothetical protein